MQFYFIRNQISVDFEVHGLIFAKLFKKKGILYI